VFSVSPQLATSPVLKSNNVSRRRTYFQIFAHATRARHRASRFRPSVVRVLFGETGGMSALDPLYTAILGICKRAQYSFSHSSFVTTISPLLTRGIATVY
ncbi:unnamed protein product, partial [Ectocarpus fasciculatus]